MGVWDDGEGCRAVFAIFFSEGAEVVWQLFSLVLWLPPGQHVV